MTLALGALAGLGRKTVTGMLCTTGQQFCDWTAAYRVFSKSRFDPQRLFGVARANVARQLEPNAPFMAAIDDTHLRKTGKHVHGASWRRDPLGPAFQTNLIWAQRFLQIAATLPFAAQPGPATSVPVDFLHAPTPRKPKKNDSEELWEQYRQARKEKNLSCVAAQRIQSLRDGLDNDGHAARALWMSGDGGYTNENVLKHLPERTVFIGRIRKDAKLYHAPADEKTNPRGRKPSYGSLAPTPEHLRQDDGHPWQTVSAWASGKVHAFRIKTLAPIQWRTAGHTQLLRLIVIAPLGYRLRKNAAILYRQPAYLICTAPTCPVEKILQAYLWRWGIEANHRDEKQLIGVGQAHVRTETAANNVPAMLVASYAFLRLAARHNSDAEYPTPALPPPLWNRKANPQPACTTRVIQQLRAELWGRGLGLHFSGFVHNNHRDTKSKKCYPDLASTVLYATN